MEDNKDKISIGTVVDKSNTNELFHIANPEGIIQITGTGSKDELNFPNHIETSENIGKIVYVIDRSGDFSYTEELRKILGYSEDTEIICVQSVEDIPFEETIKSDRSSIIELHNYSMKPDIKFEPLFKDKHKGHERPYKYHK